MESMLSGALQGRSGPLFWVSALAAAAAITALTVALLLAGTRLVRARRLRAAAGRTPPLRPPVAAANRAAPAPAMPPTATVLRAYQALAGGEAALPDLGSATPAPGGVEPGQGGNAVRLVPLLGRLRAAANRLEEVALALEPPVAAGPGNSDLKTGPDDVEYLFRTGV